MALRRFLSHGPVDKRRPARAPKWRPLAWAVAAFCLGGGMAAPAAAQLFPPVLGLDPLAAGDGYRLDGAMAQDRSGYAVSGAGDFNGDGLADLLIGAHRADPAGLSAAGSSYLVFGRATPVAAPIALSGLDGSAGFRLDGVAAEDRSGFAVAAAGDVNGDGFDDVVIGANTADPNGSASGSAYVVFGRAAAPTAALALASLDGSNGFRLDGNFEFENAGIAVAAAGDVNHDGLDDVLVGATGSLANGTANGRSYVVFGRATAFPAALLLGSLDGSNGFRLDGAGSASYSGRSVAAAGDVNGDQIGDLIIGADLASHNGEAAGAAYVIFGRSTAFPAAIALASLDGGNGFRVDGEFDNDHFGRAVSGIGDLNGDGRDDVLIGADSADANDLRSGRAYVVYGRSTPFPPVLAASALDGSTGFSIDGLAMDDRLGRSLGPAGDFNGDGRADLVIGAIGASQGAQFTGSSYVLFGRATGFPAKVSLAQLDGHNGLRLDGAAARDYAGRSVRSAGDVNGDGMADLLIGADGADAGGSGAGSTYLIFGRGPGQIFHDGFE